MNKKTKIAFIASECQPFFASGGLADVIGSLPQAIVSTNPSIEVNVFLPLYKSLNPEYQDRLQFIDEIIVNLSWRKQLCKIYLYSEKGVNYYFIDNEYCFNREKLYGYYDDAERFALFSKACIDTMLKFKLVPDIIHCHDWQTALVLVYLRTLYYYIADFKNMKRIFTIHNIEYQGIFSFDTDIIEDVFGIDNNDGYILEYDGCINLMKAAMECANLVTTVSPNYAEEIKRVEYAHNLENEVKRVDEEGKLSGILNGIDYNFYNPETDKHLFVNYNKDCVELKKQNKTNLQSMIGLPVDENIPLVGMVTRLVWHKGLDILKGAIVKVLEQKLQLVILGTGDIYYEGFFKDIESKYPNQIKVIIAFNQDLSRKIYAASDFFLMPSFSEPCGLSQMIASRYGSIPMVRSTGGLKDSIHEEKEFGNGFTFDGMDSSELVKMCQRAMDLYYKDDTSFIEACKKVMSVDFSWKSSANNYIELYNKLLNK